MNPLVKLELVRESLIAVVSEMRANVIRASYSSVIFEGHDFSCALMTSDGRQIAQGVDDHPLHIFAVPWSTRAVLDAFGEDINEGDVFLHNDPYTGGTHLNDVLMLKPVFASGRRIFFSAIRAHWNDVGGMTPGSLSGAVTEVIQEGLRIPPTRVIDGGRMNHAAMEILFANMRLVEERRGDFRTMLGASEKASEHLDRLVTRFGVDELLHSCDELIARAERRMRDAVSRLPPGEYYAEGYVESTGQSADPLKVSLRLVIAQDGLLADFTGSSAQVAGVTNVGPALAPSAVFTIAKAFLDPKVPINHGSFAPIKVYAPEGSFINARYPAPCGGMAEVKFLIESVVAAAFCQAAPDRAVGDLKGGANHTHIAGYRRAGKEQFILYEWPAGGTGATATTDGSNAVRTYTEGDFNSIQSAEGIEASFPLRVERCEIREDSCGDGQHRGGFGLRREIRVLGDDATLSVLSEKNVIPPYGVDGGASSHPNRFRVLREAREVPISKIPGKVSGFPLKVDDLIRTETAGGGGWGLALDRPADWVVQDVREGYLSLETARDRYGVMIDSGVLAEAATEDLRARLRTERVIARVALLDAEGSSTRRLVVMDRDIADRLRAAEGDLCELSTGRGAPLRGWLRISEVTGGIVRIAGDAMAILRARSGDQMEVRRLASPGARS